MPTRSVPPRFARRPRRGERDVRLADVAKEQPDRSGAEPEHGGASEELLPIEVAFDQLVDQVVLDWPGLVAPELLDQPPGLAVHPILLSRLPRVRRDLDGRGVDTLADARGAPVRVLLVESSSALMGSLSHVARALVKECSAYGSRFPNVVRSDRGAQQPERDRGGRADARERKAGELRGCAGDPRRPRSPRRRQPPHAVRDLPGVGIAKSTLHRICVVLVERGWAVRDREGRFDLGIRALRLGSSSAELPVVTAFRTVAAEFITRHDETIALAVLDGVESLFIAIEDTSQPVRLVTHVGSKTPAFASASGRVVLWPRSHPPPSRRCSAACRWWRRRGDG